MNIKLNIICAVILLSLATSACGMKRALTLPKKEPIPSFAAELSRADSIDVLRTR